MAGLSAKIGADDREFTEVLERSSRRFRSFGRELNESALGVGRALGGSTKALSGLGEGFKIAGAAAGLFAGIDGLLGIAGSLAVGGPVLAGMAAITYAMKTFESQAEDTKTAIEQFNKELGKIPQSARGLEQLRNIQKSLEGALNAKRAAEAAQATPAASAVGAAGLGSEIARQGGIAEYIKGIFGKSNLQESTAQLNKELETTTAAADDLGNALITPEGQIKTMTERADKLRDVLTAMTKASETGTARETFITQYISAWDEANDLVRAHGREVGKIGDIVRQLYIDFKNTPLFDLRGAQAAAASVNAILRGALTPQLTPIGGGAAGFGQTKIGTFVAPAPQEVKILPQKVSEVTQALKAGFAELPGALAGVLGTLLSSVFGNNRGAQIGGAVAGAFGTGVGGFLGGKAAEHLGGLLGAGIGSVIPILGTAVGGLIGGALGGLFGGHKKSIDSNTSAISAATAATNRLTQILSNIPTGIKIDRYRYGATNPEEPPPSTGGTGTGGTTDTGTGTGSTGTGGTHPEEGTVIHIGNLSLPNVTDGPSFVRYVGQLAQKAKLRGGSTSLSVAVSRMARA